MRFIVAVPVAEFLARKLSFPVSKFSEPKTDENSACARLLNRLLFENDMSITVGTKTMSASYTSVTSNAPTRAAVFTPAKRRAGLLAVIAVAVIAGSFANPSQASHLAMVNDGAALTRLMRFIAVIKAGMAVVVSAVVLWRLGAAITLPWFIGYSSSCAAMAVGPGLIWGMASIGLGALLLHGGLLISILLVWRDPAVGVLLANTVAARRQFIASRAG